MVEHCVAIPATSARGGAPQSGDFCDAGKTRGWTGRKVCGVRSTVAAVSIKIGNFPANFGWNLKTSVMSVEFHSGMLVSAWIFVCSPVAAATLFKSVGNFCIRPLCDSAAAECGVCCEMLRLCGLMG